jgi:hypothetical protein
MESHENIPAMVFGPNCRHSLGGLFVFGGDGQEIIRVFSTDIEAQSLS